MKKIVIFFLTFIIAIVVNSVAFSQNIKSANITFSPKANANNSLTTPPETDSILKIANTQINSFINNIPDQNLGDYGFKNREELNKIIFGNPIKIFTLKDTAIVFTSTWRVPIVIDNEYRALLTIIKENGAYKAVDFGARVLAEEIFKKKTVQTSGLLRVYELKSDFIIEGFSRNQLKFIPIQNTERKSYNLNDIFNLINK